MGKSRKHWKDVLYGLVILGFVTVLAAAVWLNGSSPDDRRNNLPSSKEEWIEKKRDDWTPLMP